MPTRILVTGATGFAGGHLIERLMADSSAEIHGLSRRGEWPAVFPDSFRRIPLHGLDLNQSQEFERLLRDVRPDQIYHLAGFASPGKSFREPNEAWKGNFEATRSMLDAIVNWGGRPRILYVSTGLVYGDYDGMCNEQVELRPGSPYASSKIAAEMLAFQYGQNFVLPVIRVRPFNQIGPRQEQNFATARFASQVAAVEMGKQEPLIATGDLSSSRDLTDVRDMAAAYHSLMERGRPGEVYNAGSGSAFSMEEVLDRLVAAAQVKVRIEQQLIDSRPKDRGIIRADSSKLRRDTGWTPQISFDQSLQDLLNYWRWLAG